MELAAAILLRDGLDPVAASPVGQVLLNSEDWSPLAAAARLSISRNLCPGILSVPRSGTPASWLVWLIPMLDAASGSNGAHLLLVFDPEQHPGLPIPALRAAFHLTNAEARLVEQLLMGKTPAEAAVSLGVSIHTVRTYLKRLYLKLGVKSQALLMRKLLQVATFSIRPAA